MKAKHEIPILTLSLTEDNVSCRIICASSNVSAYQNSVSCFLNGIQLAETCYKDRPTDYHTVMESKSFRSNLSLSP